MRSRAKPHASDTWFNASMGVSCCPSHVSTAASTLAVRPRPVCGASKWEGVSRDFFRMRSTQTHHAVHDSHVVLIRQQPVFDGRTNFEQQAQRGGRVPRKTVRYDLIVKLSRVVRLFTEVPDHVVAAVALVEEPGDDGGFVGGPDTGVRGGWEAHAWRGTAVGGEGVSERAWRKGGRRQHASRRCGFSK